MHTHEHREREMFLDEGGEHTSCVIIMDKQAVIQAQ